MVVLLGGAAALAPAADWLNEGGDAQRSGWQRREEVLTPRSVTGLRLIWKRRLEAAGTPLSAPVMLRRVLTWRGSVELVYVASTSGHVYAVDTDFGRVFWTRRIEAGWRTSAVATPVISPLPAGADEDDDGPPPPRPLYVLGGSGRLYALNPGDGKDASPARLFLPAGSRASSLNLFRGTVYTATERGLWSLAPGGEPRCEGGAAGEAVIDASGRVRVRSGRGEATWSDAAGTPWRAGILPNHALAGWRGAERVWTTARLASPGAPVMAGGVVFVVAGARLIAFDAVTGRRLYAGDSGRAGGARGSALGIANGHICFTGGDGFLYCYGFPVDV